MVVTNHSHFHPSLSNPLTLAQQPTGSPHPTGLPTSQPTNEPTSQPSQSPLSSPTGAPWYRRSMDGPQYLTLMQYNDPGCNQLAAVAAIAVNTCYQTMLPPNTKAPTRYPTVVPSLSPTKEPSVSPTIAPSQPSLAPSPSPVGPSPEPSVEPSIAPTLAPSRPTVTPTRAPTLRPSAKPTLMTFPPTVAPTNTRNLTFVCSELSGYCGPTSVCSNVVSPKPTCIFPNPTRNYFTTVTAIQCKTCGTSNPPSTDTRCTAAALSAIIRGPGIKVAYCNDAFLVIHSDLTSGYGNQLGSVPNPPATIDSTGTSCVTRVTNTGGYKIYKIPLVTKMLNVSWFRNNANIRAFPGGAGTSATTSAQYISNGVYGISYGLPTKGPIGNPTHLTVEPFNTRTTIIASLRSHQSDLSLTLTLPMPSFLILPPCSLSLPRYHGGRSGDLPCLQQLRVPGA